jgi:hypothetical protein
VNLTMETLGHEKLPLGIDAGCSPYRSARLSR